MADREVNFTIKATDEFSATFGNAAKDIEDLRKQLSLPMQGPLTKSQQALENNALGKIRAMETAGIKSRMDALVDKALGLGGTAAPAAVAKDAFADFDKMFEGAKSPARRMDDLAQSTKKAKGEASGLGNTFQGFTKALVTFEMIKRVIDAIDRGTQLAGDAAAKFGSGIGRYAMLDSIVGAIPGGRFVQRNVVGDQSLDDMAKNMDAKAKMVADSLALSDQLKAAKFFDSKTVNSDLSDFERQSAAIRKEQFFRVQSIQAEKVKATDELEANFRAGVLTGDDYTKAKSTVERDNQRRDDLAAAAKSEADAKVAELEKKRNQQIEAQRRAHLDSIRGLENESAQVQLATQGKLFEAKLKGIHDEEEQEHLAATRRYNDEVKNPNLAAGAEERLQAARKAIRDRAGAKEVQARQDNDREVQDINAAHQQRQLDYEADFASRRAKIVGQTRDADRLGLQKQLADRLEQIRQGREDEIRQHAERADEIKRRAADETRAAIEGYQVGNEELNAQREQMFRPSLPGGIQGEAGILTGVVGQGGAYSQTEAKALAERQAKAAEATKTAVDKLTDKIGDLVTALTGTTATFQPPP